LVFAATAFQTADQSYGHVVVASQLATEPNTRFGHAAGLQDLLFGYRHLVRLAGDEGNTASGTAGSTPASVQLIGASLFDERFDQPFASWDLKLANVFNS
jgi:hypothetical protein